MGNSSSRRSPAVETISSPKALSAGVADEHHHHNHPPTRRPSARSPSSPSSNLLAIPVANNHRRSRSAQASSARASTRVNRESAPPPYQVAVAQVIPEPEPAPAPRLGGSLAVPSPAPSRRASAPSNEPYMWWRTSSHGSIEPGAGASVADEPERPFAERAESLRRPLRQNSVENALDTLRKYNTVILVDDSGSMEGERWREARDALAALADIASKYDADGIDVCFLNSKKVGTNMKNADLVRRLFDSVRPNGITPIGEKLESLLLYYLQGLEQAKARFDAGDQRAMKNVKPVNYIIITDGAATDDPEEVIVAAARRLDAHNFPLTQVGIQFVQIGSSREATAFLDELDNGLSRSYGIRDIVDTTPYTGGQITADMIIKILLGGINRRVDRRGGGSVI